MTYLRWLQDLSRADFLQSVGLYVTRERLLLVRMRKNLLRLSVVEEATIEIPHGEDPASRRQTLSEGLRSRVDDFDPARDSLYICLAPDQAISFQLFLPQVAEENLAQVLEYEVARQLPFRREEVYYDFLLMGKKGDKVGLFLFAVPKKILDELLDTLSALGVKPKGVETTVTALSNYLLFCTDGLTGPALVLGGQNQVYEMVGVGAKKNGWRQEPELLFAHWLPQSDWVRGPGREIFHSCLRESPKCFGWGAVEDFSLAVNGESFQLEDLVTLGKERLGAERGITDSSFLPALGTALRGLREAAFPGNLLPGTKREKQGRVLSWLNTGLTILLLVGLLLWGGSYPVKEEIRLRQLQKENQKLVPSVDALRREEGEFSKLRKELSFLSGLKERKGETLTMLNELSRIVPNSAYLSNLRYRDGTVELQGSAESASSLVPILERSPVFQNVGFNAPSNRGRDNRETFSLKAEIERPEGKVTKP